MRAAEGGAVVRELGGGEAGAVECREAYGFTGHFWGGVETWVMSSPWGGVVIMW